MEKDTARPFGATAVITAAIIGGAYLLDRAHKTDRPLPPEQASWTELRPSSQRSQPFGTSSQPSRSEGVGSSNSANNRVPAGTSPIQGILTCQHPEHGTVYTNAASCDQVDYDNRISHADSFNPIPATDRYRAQDYQTPQNAAGNSRTNRKTQNMPTNMCDKTTLRLHARAPPKGLNVSCKFAVGKALEIERSLAVADNPSESTWKDSYCKWVNEAREEDCGVPSNAYCFAEICRGW